MTHEIIKTENYLLVVDDSEIKKGDWFYNRVLSQSIKVQGVWLDKVDNLNSNLETFKVIAHLPLNNSPILEGVDVLPLLDDEDDYVYEDGYNVLSHKRGYDKAREKYDSLIIKTLNKFDIEIKKHLLMYSIEHSIHGKMCDGINEIRSNIIQSLSQPKMPTHFECEVVQYTVGEMSKLPLGTRNEKIKTTTNSQGQTQWVGKYIYA